MLSQTQEELILIGGFGLFWMGTSDLRPGFASPFSFLLPPSCLLICGDARLDKHARILGSYV